MKKFILLFVNLSALLLAGCEMDETTTVGGGIYGFVSDAYTSDPISGVTVTISPSSASVVTGSEGIFEFTNLSTGQYKIQATATGYTTNSRQVSVVEGTNTIGDITLTPEATEADLKLSTNKLDFGATKTELEFTLTSYGNTDTIVWYISGLDAQWLEVTPTSGVTDNGKSSTVKVVLNRDLISEDVSTIFMVNNGVGASEPIEIVASCYGYLLADIPTDGSQITEDRWVILDSGDPTAADFENLRSALRSAGRDVTLLFEQLTSIPANAFEGESNASSVETLVGVEAPRVTKLGSYSLSGLPKLTTATIADVVTIEDYAFYGCSKLENVDFPDALTIGNYAFYGCSSFTSISLSNVVSVGDYAFSGCSKLNDLSLPDVQTLGEGALSGDGSLTSAILSDLVTAGVRAFDGCTGLKELSLLYTTTVGDMAFNGCTLLATISLPRVASIGDTIFNGCSALTTLNLATNSMLTSVGETLFEGCDISSMTLNLSSAELSNIVGLLEWRGYGDFALITTDGTVPEEQLPSGYFTLASIPLNGSTIDENTWIIVDSGSPVASEFSNLISALQTSGRTIEVVFSALEAIPDEAFDSADLTYNWSISAPKVKTVGYRSFRYAGSLTTVDMEALETISQAGFDGAWGLTGELSFSNLTTLGSYAFRSCSNLTSISLSQLKTIPMRAFYNCPLLTSINASNVTQIFDYAFYNAGIVSVEFPNLYQLNYRAFQSCDSLKSATLGSVESLGSEIFSGCTLLEEITISGIKELSYCMFSDCTSLKSVSFPECTSVAEGTFFGCTSLESVTLGAVTSIGSSGFYGCTSLSSIDVPDVETLGSKAFYCCEKLTTLYLPEVETIESSTFYGCTLLESLDLSGATYLTSSSAFRNCTSLSSIDLSSLEVIEGSLSDSRYASFASCTSLKSLSLPSLKTITGYYTFSNSSALETISMPKIESIAGKTFMYCDALTTLILGTETSSPISLVVDTFSSKTFQDCTTGDIDLYLSSAESDNVTNGDTWGGYTFKSITIE